MGKPYPEVLDLVTPPPWMLSPLLLGCCHSSSFDVATPPPSMLPLPLSIAIPPSMLSLLLLCCCSFTNVADPSSVSLLLLHIAAPPSMLLLHLHVALPPSTLTLNQCCHSFDELMFLLLPNINAPPLLLLPFLECCRNLQFPSKNESFFYCRSLQLVTKQGVSHTLKSLIFLTPFDVFTPPLMLPVLL